MNTVATSLRASSSCCFEGQPWRHQLGRAIQKEDLDVAEIILTAEAGMHPLEGSQLQ